MSTLLKCCIAAAALFMATPARAADKPDLEQVKSLILKKANAFRNEQQRPSVTTDAKLTKAATAFAEFMAKNDKYGHDADGSQPSERATKQGYEYAVILENIAWQLNDQGFTTDGLAADFEKGWEESPGHRKNLLDSDVSAVGIGVAHSEKTGRYYGVQLFGRPKSDEFAFSVTNATTAALDYSVDGKKFTIEPNNTMHHHQGRPPVIAAGMPPVEFKPTKDAHFVFRANQRKEVTLELQKEQVKAAKE